MNHRDEWQNDLEDLQGKVKKQFTHNRRTKWKRWIKELKLKISSWDLGYVHGVADEKEYARDLIRQFDTWLLGYETSIKNRRISDVRRAFDKVKKEFFSERGKK